jgi:hypothetical protein
MRSFVSKKKIVAAATLGALSLGGLIGHAYWTAGGTGTGSAAAGSNVAVTVNQTNAAVTGLFPGGPASALSGDFTNPNASKVYVSSVTAVVSAVTSTGITDANHPVCATGDFQITGTSNVPGEVDPASVLVPHTGSWSGLSVSMKNTALNQDNCKNSAVTITYTANS